MSVMPTTPGAWYSDRLLTVHDMEDMQDDEFGYELDDGVLVVSPAPTSRHQLAVGQLTAVLMAACPPGLLVLPGAGININEYQHRVPDLVVISAEAFHEPFLEQPPVLAVEVAPPRTKVYDLGRKKDLYQKFGIRSYWIVTPDAQQPSLTAFELRRGKYVQAGGAEGDQEFTASRPFPVSIVPSRLVALPG
jgi:Uma2 family endonuclease